MTVSKPSLEASNEIETQEESEVLASRTLLEVSRSEERVSSEQRATTGDRGTGTGDPKVKGELQEWEDQHEEDQVGINQRGTSESEREGAESPLDIREEDAESSSLLMCSFVVESLTDDAQEDGSIAHVFKDEPAAGRVRLTTKDTLIEFRGEQRVVGNLTADLLQLAVRIPGWETGDWSTTERRDTFGWDPGGL